MKWTIRPLSDVTGFAGARQESQFTTSWSDAVTLLERELDMINARDVVLELDVRDNQIRLDGRLRGDATPASGRVRLAFESKHGDLVYATNRFTRGAATQRGVRKMQHDHQHNVYAIAKALEALRLVDRYGVTSGQQYAGFKAIGGGSPIATGPATMTRRTAAELIERLVIGDEGAQRERSIEILLTSPDRCREAVRRAKVEVHPDRRGGDHALAYEVDQAARVLGVAR
jgi:hypothetical protein